MCAAMMCMLTPSASFAATKTMSANGVKTPDGPDFYCDYFAKVNADCISPKNFSWSWSVQYEGVWYTHDQLSQLFSPWIWEPDNGPVSSLWYGPASSYSNVCMPAKATVSYSCELLTWFYDSDGDGVGDSNKTKQSTTQPAPTNGKAWVAIGGDECDADKNTTKKLHHFYDNDGDKYVAPAKVQFMCPVFGDKWFTGLETQFLGVDCDDNLASVNKTEESYADADQDLYQDSQTIVMECVGKKGFIKKAMGLGLDCDPQTFGQSLSEFFVDYDNDQFHEFNGPKIKKCANDDTLSDGLVLVSKSKGIDCNDENAAENAADLLYVFDKDGDWFHESVILSQSLCPSDKKDGDGWILASLSKGPDCFDANAAINEEKLYVFDGDGDGYEDPTAPSVSSCPGPNFINPTWILKSESLGDDCDDTDKKINPGKKVPLYYDSDHDGQGAVNTYPTTFSACEYYPNKEVLNKLGFVETNNDCNDLVWGQLEIETYFDADGDGWGSGAPLGLSCLPYISPSLPAGWFGFSSVPGDCAPNDKAAYPGKIVSGYIDADGDGEAGSFGKHDACWLLSSGTVLKDTLSDCNDCDPNVGSLAEIYFDADGDGFGNAAISKKVDCSKDSDLKLYSAADPQWVKKPNDMSDSAPAANMEANLKSAPMKLFWLTKDAAPSLCYFDGLSVTCLPNSLVQKACPSFGYGDGDGKLPIQDKLFWTPNDNAEKLAAFAMRCMIGVNSDKDGLAGRSIASPTTSYYGVLTGINGVLTENGTAALFEISPWNVLGGLAECKKAAEEEKTAATLNLTASEFELVKPLLQPYSKAACPKPDTLHVIKFPATLTKPSAYAYIDTEASTGGLLGPWYQPKQTKRYATSHEFAKYQTIDGAGKPLDADGDFLPDAIELAIGSSTTNWDTDGDGHSDYLEWWMAGGDTELAKLYVTSNQLTPIANQSASSSFITAIDPLNKDPELVGLWNQAQTLALAQLPYVTKLANLLCVDVCTTNEKLSSAELEFMIKSSLPVVIWDGNLSTFHEAPSKKAHSRILGLSGGITLPNGSEPLLVSVRTYLALHLQNGGLLYPKKFGAKSWAQMKKDAQTLAGILVNNLANTMLHEMVHHYLEVSPDAGDDLTEHYFIDRILGRDAMFKVD